MVQCIHRHVYMYVCIHRHVCMHVCTHACIFVCTWNAERDHIQTGLHMHVRMMYVCMHVCIDVKCRAPFQIQAGGWQTQIQTNLYRLVHLTTRHTFTVKSQARASNLLERREHKQVNHSNQATFLNLLRERKVTQIHVYLPPASCSHRHHVVHTQLGAVPDVLMVNTVTSCPPQQRRSAQSRGSIQNRSPTFERAAWARCNVPGPSWPGYRAEGSNIGSRMKECEWNDQDHVVHCTEACMLQRAPKHSVECTPHRRLNCSEASKGSLLLLAGKTAKKNGSGGSFAVFDQKQSQTKQTK